MSEVDAVNVNNTSGDENSQVTRLFFYLRCILIRNILSNVDVMYQAV